MCFTYLSSIHIFLWSWSSLWYERVCGGPNSIKHPFPRPGSAYHVNQSRKTWLLIVVKFPFLLIICEKHLCWNTETRCYCLQNGYACIFKLSAKNWNEKISSTSHFLFSWIQHINQNPSMKIWLLSYECSSLGL